MLTTVDKALYQSIDVSNHVEPLLAELISQGFISAGDLAFITEGSGQAKCSSTAFLIEQYKIPPMPVALALSRCLQLDYVDLNTIAKEDMPENLIDETFIKKHQVLPLFIRDDILYLGIREPAQLGVCRELKFHTDLNVKPVIVEWDKLAYLIAYYINRQQYHVFNQPLAVDNIENDSRVVNFVHHIILDAIQKSASDIHFEPHKTTYRIRLRIDGMLHKVAQLPIDLTQRITARLKIMSKLDIAEKRLPQDGRFNIAVDENITRDCRISTCPTLFGEKTVVRILDSDNISLNINELGMENHQQTLFLKEIKKPQGMILVTGPTGSGKTLTLYSALNLLNTLDKNISTVEDPVEIELPGLNQVHINSKANLTFASVLRAFLRQDPDILMVGEIRDKETADIAIKAAQTGHLVLSTLHTNSAYETLSRLQMMGVSIVNLIDAVRLIVAQRLVRKLCAHCKNLSHPAKDILLTAGFSPHELNALQIYEAVGCKHCTKGYSGRLGIFELLPITEEIKHLIVQKSSAVEIKQQAQWQGFVDLQTAVLNKIRTGITSLEEAYRIAL